MPLVGCSNDYWVDEMADVLDADKKVSHVALTTKLSSKIDDASFFKKIEKLLPSDFDSQQLDWSYGPVVQSGGQYDFKMSAQSNAESLNSGVIVTGLGFRYKTYCATLARSYLIDPSPVRAGQTTVFSERLMKQQFRKHGMVLWSKIFTTKPLALSNPEKLLWRSTSVRMLVPLSASK